MDSERIVGDTFRLTSNEIAFFHEHGYLSLPNIVTPDELSELQRVYLSLVSRDLIPADEWGPGGRDFGDHSLPEGVPESEWHMVNCTLPTTHYPPWSGNIYERRAQSIARQLYGDTMVFDYDQLLSKKPNRPDAVFEWHQDAGYWWQTDSATPTRTATVSLAMNDADEANGCLRVIPGSHKAARVRPHSDLFQGSQEKTSEHHLLQLKLKDDEFVQYLPVKAGGATVHEEFIVHGSGGNTSPNWRHTYVAAFRDAEMVKFERSKGFRHSYCDLEALDLLRNSIKQRASRV